MFAVTDYTLAKRALLRQVRTSVVSRLDVCDAHPELLRAAKNVGEGTGASCPLCGRKSLRLVTYVFGDGLKNDSGRVWPRNRVGELLDRTDELACYVVEVCVECCWNHLVRSFLLGRRNAG